MMSKNEQDIRKLKEKLAQQEKELEYLRAFYDAMAVRVALVKDIDLDLQEDGLAYKPVSD